jgi:hypothetical protein
MTTYTSSIHVEVPAEVAYAQVVELMMKPSGRTTYTVLEAPPDGVGTRIRYESRLLGLSIGGILTLTEYVKPEKLTLDWHGPERFVVGHLRGLWSFTPDEAGTTITVRSVLEPRIPVLQALAGRAMIRGFRKVELPTMKAQMEAHFREARLVS